MPERLERIPAISKVICPELSTLACNYCEHVIETSPRWRLIERGLSAAPSH
jgi:hypothetical protein